MAEIVNLRQARRKRAREEKAAAADANRRAHGLSKAEKKKAKTLRELAEARLEGHRRETGDGGGDD